MSDDNNNDLDQQASDAASPQSDAGNNYEQHPQNFEVRESYPAMNDKSSGPRFGVGRVLGTLIGVGLGLGLAAGLLVLADNLTITLFSIEIRGWDIWAFCWVYFATLACTKLGLSAFSEQGMPLSKKRRITGPVAHGIGGIILIANAAVIVGYLYVLFNKFGQIKGTG